MNDSGNDSSGIVTVATPRWLAALHWMRGCFYKPARFLTELEYQQQEWLRTRDNEIKLLKEDLEKCRSENRIMALEITQLSDLISRQNTRVMADQAIDASRIAIATGEAKRHEGQQQGAK